MSNASRKSDQAIVTILGQLEILQELAIAGEATQLAEDLSVLFSKTLHQYCDSKRRVLEHNIARTNVKSDRRSA